MIAAIVAGGLVLGGGGVGAVLLAMNGSSPSRAEFVTGADDVCRPANGPVAAIVKPTSYPELTATAGTLAATIDSQVGQLRALDPPGGADGVEVARVFTALEGTGLSASRLQQAAGSQDEAATIVAAKDLAGQAQNARTEATTTGFAACSVGMQTGIDAVFEGARSIIKAGFVAESDVLCRRASRELGALGAAPQGAVQYAAYLGRRIAVFDRAAAAIGALPVAPGDEAVVEEIVTAETRFRAKNREMQDAAAANDVARFDALERERATLTTAVDARWDAYGVGSCGSNFGG